ncbi:hypothetical protein V7182_23775 [Neobacillus drentensis]|uniref:hypothetical protein n=1 Tax=Neobacillus drentensis TaxID=220684 RepID=UPI002FFE3950
MLSDYEMILYKCLSEKAETEPLTYEELSQLNDLHVSIIRNCYESVKQIEEQQDDLKDTLKFVSQAWDESEQLNKIYDSFIEEKGLEDEFLDVFKAVLEENEGLVN